MRKERLTYRELLRRLSSRSKWTADERRAVQDLLAVPEDDLVGHGLAALFESLASRRALLRLAPRPGDSAGLRRYLDPETDDRWAFAAPASSPPAPSPPAASVPPPAAAAPVVAAPVVAAPVLAAPTLSPAVPAPAPRDPAPRPLHAVEFVLPQPGVARRFLDDAGEPLATFFSIIAARRSADELGESFEPIRAQLLARTSATDARLHFLSEVGAALESAPGREGLPQNAHLLGGLVVKHVIGERSTLHVANLAARGTGEEGRSGALVSLPLALGERLVGVLEILRDAPGAFASDEIDLFALAAQVAAGSLVRAERLERLIFVDKLTGLYNRAYFDDQIEREIERANRTGTSVALLMADLDHFKKINDNFGHQAGDGALAHLASIFRGNIRQIDVAARYGGEEFAILLPSITRARAVRTAERLRRVVADANFSEVIPELAGMKMSVSLGLALYPDDAATSKQLIDRADRVALYAAKNRGRNRVVSWASAREGTESLKSAG